MSYDFIAIDFETANYNLNSACALGLVAVKGMKIVETRYFLIQPPIMYFHEKNIEIHGITPKDVKDSPSFQDVWEEIKHYFDNNIIFAHNASFDMSVLRNCLVEYRVDFPSFPYVCTIDLSARLCDKTVGRSLVDRVKHFNIKLEKHHYALDDALACANLAIECINSINSYPFKTYFSTYLNLPVKNFENVKPQKKIYNTPINKFKKVSASEVSATSDCFDGSHIFYGKNIVFTGELINLVRKDAMQHVVNVGGIVKDGMSSKIDFLIVGTQDTSVVGEDGISTKEIKAQQLKIKGHHIQIIREDEFLKMLK